MENKNYRPDIDGLRAIAVLAVLFYHTDIPGFSGGFVGVDIFFVISGFLITSIILRDIKQGTFSIAQFYERRIRRIFPALFTVVFATILIGVYLLDKNALNELGQSIVATTLFSSNIWFWTETGYFAETSLQKPLLHTWSLAVEEQFYIIFPLVLIVINRYFKSRYCLWLVIATIISLICSIYGIKYHPDATFYLVPTRAWELMVGSVLALGVIPISNKKIHRNIISSIGIGLLFYSITCFNDKTPFPGEYAIIPVMGSGLIIYGNNVGSSMINKIISIRPIAFIGLISYSLYLWHWPFLAFSKYIMFRPLTGSEKFLFIIINIFIAYLSWRYIEQPFRGNKLFKKNRKKLFSYAAGSMVLIAGIGLFIHFSGGLGWRFPMVRSILDQGKWEWHATNQFGILQQSTDSTDMPVCGDTTQSPSFVLWGDSHAMSLIPGCDISAKRNGISGYIATHTSCPPLVGYNVQRTNFDESLFNQNVISLIQERKSIKTVLLSAVWSDYMRDDIRNSVKGFNDVGHCLRRTIDLLLEMKMNVVLVSDYPWIMNDDYSVRSFYLQKRFPVIYDLNEIIKSPTFEEYTKLNKYVIKLFEKVREERDVVILYPESRLFDNNGVFVFAVDNIPLYRDASHLSTYGSKYISSLYDPVFKQIKISN